MSSLNKWGGSTLIVRRRVLPSGVPFEKIFKTAGPDITWQEDFKHFEQAVAKNTTSLAADIQQSLALANIVLGATSKSSLQRKIYKKIARQK